MPEMVVGRLDVTFYGPSIGYIFFDLQIVVKSMYRLLMEVFAMKLSSLLIATP
jgi:hypothetical protein